MRDLKVQSEGSHGIDKDGMVREELGYIDPMKRY